MDKKKIFLIQNKNQKIKIQNLEEKLSLLDYEITTNFERCDCVLFCKEFYHSKQLISHLNYAAIMDKIIISTEDLFIEFLNLND